MQKQFSTFYLEKELTLNQGAAIPWSPKVSAKYGTNIEELLEYIQLQAVMCELYSPTPSRAEITVLESRENQVTGVVRCGILRPGSWLVCGISLACVTRLRDESGKEIKPSPTGTACTY